MVADDRGEGRISPLYAPQGSPRAIRARPAHRSSHEPPVSARQRAGNWPESSKPGTVVGMDPELVRHVAASTGLPGPVAARVVADVVAYFSETTEEFVRRRHR